MCGVTSTKSITDVRCIHRPLSSQAERYRWSDEDKLPSSFLAPTEALTPRSYLVSLPLLRIEWYFPTIQSTILYSPLFGSQPTSPPVGDCDVMPKEHHLDASHADSISSWNDERPCAATPRAKILDSRIRQSLAGGQHRKLPCYFLSFAFDVLGWVGSFPGLSCADDCTSDLSSVRSTGFVCSALIWGVLVVLQGER